MDAKLLIETLKDRGVELQVNGDRIRVEADQEPDPKTKILLHEIRQHREEVKALLTDNPLPDDTIGVTAADVLRIFGSGLVIEEHKPLICLYCNKKKGVSGWRKDGKIIRRIRADGFPVWACHFCGREAKGPRGSVVTIH